MKEKLLHFIWKLKLFSTKKIDTTKGESIEILSTGTENLNSGPDFINAKISINNQLWAGNVEIHVNSSDWYIHQHEIDQNYDSVILHVVWEHDVEIFRRSNEEIPTLELKKYISKELLWNYNQLFGKTKKWINCENDISTINSFTFLNWIERLYFERLEQKSIQIHQILKITNNNWEQTLFVLLAKNFGLHVNSDAFMSFANSFDFSILRKSSSSLKQLEALFMGQAGLLQGEVECEHYKKLKEEYDYLKRKFKLISIGENQIQFFRLRPNNFPTIRLSQLANLYYTNQNLFSQIIDIKGVDSYYELLSVTTSEFWETHYTFKKQSKKRIKSLTKSFIDLLLINTIIPLKFVYLKSLGKSDITDLISLIEEIKPEKNSIISKFNDLKIETKSAFATQALLQLKNEYCNKQRCLDCIIGSDLLKN